MSSRDDCSYSAIPKTMSAQVQEPLRTEAERPVRWHISARAPLTMLALFVSGVLVSIGHHFFYSRLDGSAVRSLDSGSQYLTQIWIIRYGTAFAFLAKSLLASAVVVAYKQHIWINLRARANTVSTIDAMFAATYDVLAVLSPSLLLKAKIPALLALITWLLPLAALITPSTLIVVPSTREDVSMMHVPTLNFNNSALYSFSGLGDSTSPLLTRLTTAMASNMEVLPMRAIASNTTYSHEFVGPSLKCEPATERRLANMTAIWNHTQSVLSGSAGGKLMYLAYTQFEYGEQKATETDVKSFVSRCVTGDAYSAVCLPYSGPAISARVGNESITCSVHDTRFNITFRAVGNTQTMNDVRFTWLGKSNAGSSWGTPYQATGQALATLLNGAIGASISGPAGQQFDSGTAGLNTRRTRVMSTALIGLVSTGFTGTWGGPLAELPSADRSLAANKTLAMMIEELSRNQTLSLFSSERLWLPQNATNTTLVTQATFYTVYEYRARNLIMTYGIAIAFSAFGVLLGLRALWLNGICHETSFSSIMTTTRNRYLDEMTLGYSLGSAPTPWQVQRLALRFGGLKDGGSEERTRAAFGLEGDTVPLRKGQMIY